MHNSRADLAEEISKLEGRLIKIMQSERENRIPKTEQDLRDTRDSSQCTSMWRVHTRRGGEKERETAKDMMAEDSRYDENISLHAQAA